MISIIIPVYNSESTLEKLMTSLKNQTSKDFQAIFVDDGSTDDSSTIIDGYAKDHSFVKVIHKSNGGLSSARNAGMKVSDGEYLTFLDADDYLEENAIEIITNVLNQANLDFVDFGFYYVPNGTEKVENRNHLPKNQVLEKAILTERVIPRLVNIQKDDDAFIFDYAWNKVYKKEIIEQEHLHFYETRRTWEDRLFVVQYLKFCNNYFSIDQCLYNYVFIPGSLSQKYSLQFFDLILENYKIYFEWYGNEYSFETAYAYEYWSRIIENMLYRSVAEKEQLDAIEKIVADTIKTDCVRHWFSSRDNSSSEASKITNMVLCGDAEGLLDYFVQKRRKDERKKNSFMNKLKCTIKRVLM